MTVGVDEAWDNNLIRSIDNVHLSTWQDYVGFDLGNAISHDEDVIGANKGLIAVVRKSHDSAITYEFGLVRLDGRTA